jgi:hypothetical protein
MDEDAQTGLLRHNSTQLAKVLFRWYTQTV